MKNASEYEAYQSLKNQITKLLKEHDPSGAALLEIAVDVAERFPALSHVASLIAVTHEQMVILEHREDLLKKNGIPIE